MPPDLVGSGGTAWGDDGLIVAAGSDSVGLRAIPEQGGEGRDLVPIDRTRESDFHEVSALPGGRGFLYAVHRTEGLDTIELFAAGTRRVLLQLPGESLRSPVYSATGHILYRRESTSPGVWGLAFSLADLAVSGAPFQVVPGGQAPSVARDGSLAFVRASDAPSELVWVSRAGGVEAAAEMPGPVNSSTADVAGFDLSPDGRRVAVNVLKSGYGELWVGDLVRGSTSRLFDERADSLSAVWTPDGHVVFSTLLQSRRWNLWKALADGASRPERLTQADATQNPKDVSPDGRYLVFAQGVGLQADLWLLPLDGSGPAAEWLAAAGNQGFGASFSPDSRFLAYESDETGRSEVYVRPFPAGEGRWQLSTDGGRLPAWSPAGGEVFYRSRERMMSVKVAARGTGLEVGAPSQLFLVPPGSRLSTEFKPSADGQRFLMSRSRTAERMTLVLNWPREAARLAGGAPR
jgi:hypothetical protein